MIKIVTTCDLANSIVGSNLPTEENLKEEKAEEALLTVAEKLGILARAHTVLGGIILIPETVDLYIGRAQRLLHSGKSLTARQTRIVFFLFVSRCYRLLCYFYLEASFSCLFSKF